MCIDTGERWYLPETLLSSEDKELLDKELLHFFDGNHHVLYISQLYDSVQKQLSNNLVTPELFGVVLRSQYRRKYYFSREVIADTANVRLDIAKEIENEPCNRHSRKIVVSRANLYNFHNLNFYGRTMFVRVEGASHGLKLLTMPNLFGAFVGSEV